MTRVSVQRSISAPLELVFRAVTDVETSPDRNPDVVSVEFLSERRSGVGTRFVETRRMGKKEMQTELDVTEFVENERARMVADSHGTIWDTTFTVRDDADGVVLNIAMDARAHAFLPKIMNPLMKGFFRRGIEKYADQVKSWCETTAGS